MSLKVASLCQELFVPIWQQPLSNCLIRPDLAFLRYACSIAHFNIEHDNITHLDLFLHDCPRNKWYLSVQTFPTSYNPVYPLPLPKSTHQARVE